MKAKIILPIIGLLLLGAACQKTPSQKPPANTPTNTGQPAGPIENASTKVNWQLGEGNVWESKRTPPPPCPEPLVLATPVDLTRVTSILYPGQVRGDAFKPHGGFRFTQMDNRVTVTAPMDAQVVRASSTVVNGEHQYAFEFIAPCGIRYTFGHLLELAPKFQAIVDALPPNDPQSPFATLMIPVPVTAGETIATAVGYANEKNAFVDWGVYDLRQKNGVRLRPEWSQYQSQFDAYAVCWLDLLPAEDSGRVKALPGGDFASGKMSDYCR